MCVCVCVCVVAPLLTPLTPSAVEPLCATVQNKRPRTKWAKSYFKDTAKSARAILVSFSKTK